MHFVIILELNKSHSKKKKKGERATQGIAGLVLHFDIHKHAHTAVAAEEGARGSIQ
jgi:hypothetical protein